MKPEIIARHDRPVPRYTSYPTAPNFTPKVDGTTYRAWLSALDRDAKLSLYLHIPFCNELCWYCGCNTQVVRRGSAITAYVDDLIAEIDLVAKALPPDMAVEHIHFGGGSPNSLTSHDLARLAGHLRNRFDFAPNLEFAVEVDPRTNTEGFVSTCADIGVTRVSLGVQDLNDDVQQAVNRIQPPERIAEVLGLYRSAGIEDINVDLMYGLPLQTVDKVLHTIDQVLDLAPEQIALFGYAHVPWLKKHMRLIDATQLPGPEERWAQSEAASKRLQENGYRAVGMDHFARGDTALAKAVAAGRLNRNFQGYTADDAIALIGFGSSAIGSLPQGYVQNETDARHWKKSVASGELATVRGCPVGADDQVRRAVIMRLMCDMEVDVDEIASAHDYDPTPLRADLIALTPMEDDALVVLNGPKLRMTELGRPFVRVAAAAFDRHLQTKPAAGPRHSSVV